MNNIILVICAICRCLKKTVITRFALLILIFFLQCHLHSYLLVIGCGRSGTTYCADFLEKSGYEIYHERLGADGSVSWLLTPLFLNGDLLWGLTTLSHLKEEFSLTPQKPIIFHQVRHPLSVITSWFINLTDLDNDQWLFVRLYTPEIHREDSLLVHCAKYWYYWNLRAEQIAEWTYRVENLKECLPEFMHRSGLILDSQLLDQIPSTTNSGQVIDNKLTWSDLKRELPEDLYYKILEMAFRYGYIADTLSSPSGQLQ